MGCSTDLKFWLRWPPSKGFEEIHRVLPFSRHNACLSTICQLYAICIERYSLWTMESYGISSMFWQQMTAAHRTPIHPFPSLSMMDPWEDTSPTPTTRTVSTATPFPSPAGRPGVVEIIQLCYFKQWVCPKPELRVSIKITNIICMYILNIYIYIYIYTVIT